MDSRIDRIKTYFTEYGFVEILTTIGYTFLILISTYVLLNLSRLIINFFEKIITPKVYKLTDKSSIVLKEDYNKLKAEINKLESKIQDERDMRFRVQNENDQLEKRVKELINPEVKSDTDASNKTNKSVKKTKSDIIYDRLQKEKRLKVFDEIAGSILNKRNIDSRGKNISDFTKLGLITQGTFMSGPANYKYGLTSDGKNVHDRILIEDSYNNYV